MNLRNLIISGLLAMSFLSFGQDVTYATDPVTDWQIHVDTATGFSIHFPKDWKATPAQRGFFCGEKPGYRQAKWSVIFVPIDDEEGKTLFFSDDKVTLSGIKSTEKNITLDGRSARYVLETHETWEGMYSESVYIKTDRFWFFISNDGEKEEGFEQFYKSFRLIK